MSLTKTQIKSLRSQAHHLKPVVMVGQNGLKDSILEELEIALDFHELIKVKVAADKEERQEIAEELVHASKAELVQHIGQMIILFRRNPKKPKIILPSS
ncbi:MAG: ribosome assembly RNA-binding protein YhbY [Gammaproteobacteria bacterium]|jgi:RNA-binding protein